VKRFWSRGEDDLGRELRAARPQLRDEFVHSLARRIESANGRHRPLYVASRLSFAASITVLVLGTLIAFGGLGYAASGTRDAVKAVKHAVAPTKARTVSNSAAQDQYVGKVTICHHTHSAKNPFVTITISRAALPAHLAHGDTIGPCPTVGVLGASATRTRGGGGSGVLGATASSGTLPFTGISLGVTVLVSLLLFVSGLALRRAAGRRQ
jgi:hypothetical protein